MFDIENLKEKLETVFGDADTELCTIVFDEDGAVHLCDESGRKVAWIDHVNLYSYDTEVRRAFVKKARWFVSDVLDMGEEKFVQEYEKEIEQFNFDYYW